MWRRHDIGLVPRARIPKFAARINLRGGFTRVGGRTWNATSLPPGRITLTPRSQPARAAFAGRSATARRHARTCAAIEQPDVPPRMALLSICRRFCRCARAPAPGREAPAITLSGTRDVCGSTLPHTPVFPHAQCGPLERMRKTGFHFPQCVIFPNGSVRASADFGCPRRAIKPIMGILSGAAQRQPRVLCSNILACPIRQVADYACPFRNAVSIPRMGKIRARVFIRNNSWQIFDGADYALYLIYHVALNLA